MAYFRSSLIAFIFSLISVGTAHAICDDTTSMLDFACKRVTDTWKQGGNDFYLPFYAYHLRSAYTDEKINSFREDTWGLGYGRSRYNESGNWDGLYFMSFSDSHSKPEHILGYGHQWIWGNPQNLHTGLGYTVFLTVRADIDKYTPIPGILPMASISYDKITINTAYVPGGNGNGNIFFFWSRFGF